MIHEVEEPLLGLHVLIEKLVAQQSTSDRVSLVNGQVQGDEVGVIAMEQVATQAAQVEATYNSYDDLEETTNILIDL